MVVYNSRKAAIFSIFDFKRVENEIIHIFFNNCTILPSLILYFLLNILFSIRISIIFSQKDEAFPLQFFEIVNHRAVHLLNTVQNHKDSNRIRLNSFTYDYSDVIFNTLEGVFQHSLVLTVHTDTYGQLHFIFGLREMYALTLNILVRSSINLG